MSVWELLESIFKLWLQHRKSMKALRSGNPMSGVLEAYRNGDYAAGLQAAEVLKIMDPAGYHFFRGYMLGQLGLAREAEEELRICTRLRQQGPLAAVACSSLGQQLLAMDRYDEAMKCFETSLQYDPDRGATQRDFAHAWLRRGKPEEALGPAKIAVEKERASTLSEETRELNLREALATLAWAVAATSKDRDEVDVLAAEATPPATLRAPAACAEIHVNLGKAYESLGDPRASEHFEQAARIDPNGLWGREAKGCVGAR